MREPQFWTIFKYFDSVCAGATLGVFAEFLVHLYWSKIVHRNSTEIFHTCSWDFFSPGGNTKTTWTIWVGEGGKGEFF